MEWILVGTIVGFGAIILGLLVAILWIHAKDGMGI